MPQFILLNQSIVMAVSQNWIRGKQYGELLEALSLVEDAVVDVGASNIEEFIKLMKQYRGSHEDFDFIVIPTVGTTKQMRDTIATIEAFSKLVFQRKNFVLSLI